MLKRMREGSAYFVKGVMLLVVVAFIGTIFVVWGVKSTPGDLGRRGVVATVSGVDIPIDDYIEALGDGVGGGASPAATGPGLTLDFDG